MGVGILVFGNRKKEGQERKKRNNVMYTMSYCVMENEYKRNERLVQFYFRYISSFITQTGAMISCSYIFYVEQSITYRLKPVVC